MTLTAYKQLQSQTVDQPDLLGCQLPPLQQATLQIEHRRLPLTEALQRLQQFEPEQGWHMSRGEVVVSPHVPADSDLIEGEWCRGQGRKVATLSIKLMGPNLYGVSVITADDHVAESSTDNPQVYRQQAVVLRPNLIGAEAYQQGLYRLWWQQHSQGQWLPLTQQFVGFGKE